MLFWLAVTAVGSDLVSVTFLSFSFTAAFNTLRMRLGTSSWVLKSERNLSTEISSYKTSSLLSWTDATKFLKNETPISSFDARPKAMKFLTK